MRIGTPFVANLLDVDPDLGDAVAPAPGARRDLDVRVVRLAVGPWDPRPFDLGAGALGLLLTDGLLLRRVRIGARVAAELLGQGDLVRPWHAVEPPFCEDWCVLDPVGVALLDRPAAERLARHPGVMVRLLDQDVARSRRLVERCAIGQLPSTEERLLVELHRLAERWGRVRRDGIAVELPLTQEVLGHLVGVRRQSVTTALGRLTGRGAVAPLARHGWLLRTAQPAAQRNGVAAVT